MLEFASLMSEGLDATQCDAALRFLEGRFLEEVAEPRVIDLAGLEYSGSSRLRVLLLTERDHSALQST